MRKIKIVDDTLEKQQKKDKDFSIIIDQLSQFSKYKGNIPFSYLNRTLSLILDLESPEQKKLRGMAEYMDFTENLHNKIEMFRDMQDQLSLLEYQIIYDPNNIGFKAQIIRLIDQCILEQKKVKNQISEQQLSYLLGHIKEYIHQSPVLIPLDTPITNILKFTVN